MASINLECCVTDSLLNEATSFTKLSTEEKVKVVTLGRSCPDIDITYYTGNGLYDKFDNGLFNEHLWLSGSCQLQKLFCFPCLLFSNLKSVWNSIGFSDIKNFELLMKIHIESEDHMRCTILLSEFIPSNVDSLSNHAIEIRNAKVKRNRELMKRLIDTVVLLGKQSLSLHANDKDTNDSGNYVETLLYLSKYDTHLDDHFQLCSSDRQSYMFTGLTGNVINDLIPSIASVIRDETKSEVSKSKFVSIIIHESDESIGELSVVLRYLSDAQVKERFFGLYKINERYTFNKLFQDILAQLKQYDCEEKLVGLSYDGALVKYENNSMFLAEIRNVFPKAIPVPCHAHSLTQVLIDSLGKNPDIKRFFGHVINIIRFFNKSAKHLELVKNIFQWYSPDETETYWQCLPKFIIIVQNNNGLLFQKFNSILEDQNVWDHESVSMAEFLVVKMNDFEFCFLLKVFEKILKRTAVLSNLLQSENLPIRNVFCNIEADQKWLYSFMTCFNDIYNAVEGFAEPPLKRQKLNTANDYKSFYQNFYKKIKDIIKSQLQHRYDLYRRLLFFDLINKSLYDAYCKNSSNADVSSLQFDFPNYFNKTLSNELKVLYTSPTFSNLDVIGLYKTINGSLLNRSFQETITLCELILSLPLKAPSTKETHCIFNKIHNSLKKHQNKMEFFSLSDLVLIVVEKSFLSKLNSNPKFYDDVINHFVKRTQTVDLKYV